MWDWNDVWQVVQVVLGLGLVIFVHEAGHFLAARLCKVRVDVFSLGFGPRLFGWQRGPTLYQIAAVPLGGFVKMSGDDAWPDEPAPPPDSLISKSVGQRFFIYSGGVLANVAFGIVVFPILFAVGVPFDEPVIRAPVPGSPAWEAGLPEGTRVLSVNGKGVYAFMHVLNEVALGPDGECTFEVLEPGAKEPRTVRLQPAYSEAVGAFTLELWPAFDPEGRMQVARGRPAHRAGLRSGDRLIAVEGGIEGQSLWERFFAVTVEGLPLAVRVERDGEELSAEIVPTPSKRSSYSRIGVTAPRNLLGAVRKSPRTRGLDLEPGDRILSAGGRPILRELDLERALLEAEGPLELAIDRAGRELRVLLPALAPEAVFELTSDFALAVDQDSTVLAVTEGEPAAEAGLRDGDRVLRLDGREIASYAEFAERLRRATQAGREAAIAVERVEPATGAVFAFDTEVRARPWHRPEYGLGPGTATYLYRADGPAEALEVGLVSCWKFLESTWLALRGMLVQKVSPKNVSGPIGIVVYAHGWGSEGWAKLFFFLCLLSINLAFINVLPIPLLDGGHLLFLLIEKVKGSPVSYRVMSYSQVIGLVLIVSLFVFVIYNDVQRHILG